MGKTISVVIAAAQIDSFLKDCLFSLSKVKTDTYNLEVVVVLYDENETQIQVEKNLQALYEKIHILRTYNRGFSGNNNMGIRFSLEKLKTDYVLLLNNDTRVDSTILTRLMEFAESHTKTPSAFSPKIYFEKGYEFHHDSYKEHERGKVIWYAGGLLDMNHVDAWHRGVDEVDHGQFNTPEQTEFTTGCCLLISKETIEKVGLFDEKFFLYWEDTDYAARIKKADGQLWYVPTAVVWHKNAGSSGGSGSTLHQYYLLRNKLLFGTKYAGLRTKIALLKLAMLRYRQGNQDERCAVRDFFLRRFGKRGMR